MLANITPGKINTNERRHKMKSLLTTDIMVLPLNKASFDRKNKEVIHKNIRFLLSEITIVNIINSSNLI